MHVCKCLCVVKLRIVKYTQCIRTKLYAWYVYLYMSPYVCSACKGAVLVSMIYICVVYAFNVCQYASRGCGCLAMMRVNVCMRTCVLMRACVCIRTDKCECIVHMLFVLQLLLGILLACRIRSARLRLGHDKVGQVEFGLLVKQVQGQVDDI